MPTNTVSQSQTVTKFIAAEAAKSGNPGAGQPAPGDPFPSGAFTPVPDLIAFEIEATPPDVIRDYFGQGVRRPLSVTLDRVRWAVKLGNLPGYFFTAALLDTSGGYLQPCGRRTRRTA